MTEQEGGYRGLEPINTPSTVTLDLHDRVDGILDDEIPDHEERLKDVRNLIENGHDDEPLTVAEEEDAMMMVSELEEDIDTLRHTARLFATRAEQWGGSEFEVKSSLAFHEVQRASDDIASMTVRSGEPKSAAGAKDGAYQMKVLEQAMVSTPPEAPGVTDDGFDWQIGKWLYSRFEAVNSYGDVSVGN